jgi:hypothetical protein
MTEKQKKVSLQKDYFINEKTDGFLDKISKSKWVKALFGVGVVASASQIAAASTTSPAAEVAPLNEAAVPGEKVRITATLPTGVDTENEINTLSRCLSVSLSHEMERQESSDNWTDQILEKLNDNFFKKDDSSIWYTSKDSNRKVPVLLELDKGGSSLTFQFGIETGRESVRYVNKANLYLFGSDLVAVSNYDYRVFTFDVLSTSWMEKMGQKSISDYKTDTDGNKHIIVWGRDTEGKIIEEDSGFMVDDSGAIVVSIK